MGTIKELIIGSLKPHVCTDDSCGVNNRPKHHVGCMELDSDIFIQATQLTAKRYDGTNLAPD